MADVVSKRADVKGDVTKVKAKKSKRSVDRTSGMFKTFNLGALYCSAFYYAYQNGPDDGAQDGLKFNKGWFYSMMVSDFAVFGLPALYVVGVLLLSRFMTTRSSLAEPIRKYVQPFYNVAQIVVCGWMVYGLMPQVDIMGLNPFGLNTRRNKDIEFFVFVHYLTKYMDWCDTAMMILKKNYGQVSFLQVFHHATIGMVWGFLLSRGWGSGTAAYGAWINSVTHVIMYSHYFVSSYGINNPFKAYITRFQLSQFASCIAHALLVLGYEKVYPMDYAYLQVSYHVIMLYLFGFQMAWAPVWCTGQQDIDEEKKTK